MKGEIAAMNGNMGMASNLHTQVQNLINSGFVKQSQNGNLVPVMDEDERELSAIASGSKRRPGANPSDPVVRNNLPFDVGVVGGDEESII